MAGNPVDLHIGGQIQVALAMAGMQREELASALEISPAEMLAYERGEGRISAGLLFAIAAILKKPVGFFYDGLGREKH
jgi:transcriptional regulator with XRE-family HTH domain